MSRARRASFIVRTVMDRGMVSGVIERLATGAKEAFQDIEAIGLVIARMVEREATGSPANAATPPPRGSKPCLHRGRPPRG